MATRTGAGMAPFRSPRPTLSGDRAALASVLLAAFATLVFAANLTAPRGPLVLLWIAAPLSAALGSVAAAGISRMAAFPLPTRRFWRHLALCLALVGLGATANAYDAIVNGSSSQHMPMIALVGYVGGLSVLLWGMCRLPLYARGSAAWPRSPGAAKSVPPPATAVSRRGAEADPLETSRRGDALRIWLDAGTVLLAATVFMWHYQARPMLEATGYRATAVIVGSSFSFVFEVLIVFAVVKVALAGHSYLARGTLRLFGAGLVAGALSGIPQRLILDTPHLNIAQIIIPLAMICATGGAARQRRALADPEPRRASGDRPFSRLPYLAVAAVDALLLACIWGNDADARPVAVAAVALTGLVVWRQITAFRENTDLLGRLDHSATHDSLTGLPNRALFTDRLTAALSPTRPGGQVGVALIDLDDFKAVNDTLGHAVGDALLVAVAQRLRGSVRPDDTVARLGGDEFVVILEGIDGADAEHAAQRMLAALIEPLVVEGQELLVRASVGLADGHRGGDPGELLRRADIAMYAAKQGGGGALRYTPEMAGPVEGSAALGAQLRQAITEGQLFLVYQPIVALRDGRLRGVEALVRWAHPTRGAISPAEFIPVAERTGLIVPLGDWVLREACQQFAAWSAEHGARAPKVLNVNVSARQLSDPAFADRVVAVLTDTGVPAHRLTLEITESTAVALGRSRTHLDTLRRLGVRIALDDFGTGQSSLTLLHELPVDQLKLDRSFVQPGDTGTRATMPAAVIALAEAVNLDIVAEGVETADQAERLVALGYRTAQGFHFARPMPPGDVSALLSRPALVAS